MLFNLIYILPILTVLSGLPIEKTVSDNDLKTVDVVESGDDLIKVVDDPILLKSVFNPGGYYNDDYVGWKYRVFKFTATDQLWVLLFPSTGNWYNTNFTPSSRRVEVQLRDMNNQTFAVDFNGTVQTYTYGTYPTYYQITNQSYPNSGSLTYVYNGIVEPESDIPTNDSQIDYTDLLESINEKLVYFQDLFYFGDNLDSMGDGFKVLIILTFLVAINLVIKIINWR